MYFVKQKSALIDMCVWCVCVCIVCGLPVCQGDDEDAAVWTLRRVPQVFRQDDTDRHH